MDEDLNNNFELLFMLVEGRRVTILIKWGFLFTYI